MVVSAKDAGIQLAFETATDLGLPAIPTQPDQIPLYAARQLVEELDIPIPTTLDANGLLAAARLLGSKIQLPFPLPTQIPQTVMQAVEQGLLIGAQLFGPQVLAAVGLGAAVPGVGWIASAGTILYKLISSYLVSPPSLDRYKCWPSPGSFGSTGIVPGSPTFMGQFGKDIWGGRFPYPLEHRGGVNTSPMLLFVWAQASLSEALAVRGDQTRMKEYHESMVLQCITNNRELIRHQLLPLVVTSIDDATAPEALGVLAMLGYLQASYSRPLEYESVYLIEQLTKRVEFLQGTLNDYDAVLKHSDQTSGYDLTAHISDLMAVINKLVGEMRIAGVAVQRSQLMPYWYEVNLAQFATVTSMYARLEQLKRDLVAKSMVGQRELTPEEEMARWQAEEAGQVWAPATEPGLLEAYNRQCVADVSSWIRLNPEAARCLGPADEEMLLAACVSVKSGTLSSQQMRDGLDLLVNQRCEAAGVKRPGLWRAFVDGVVESPNPVELLRR